MSNTLEFISGLLAGGLLLLLVPGFRNKRALTLWAAVIGALTHAPLDLCTSYGTKVYWPFSLDNATLDLFPIIDPVFTLVLIACVVFAGVRRSRTPALVGMVFLAVYVGTAFEQRSAAVEAQAALAASRGHRPVRARVMPLPASLLAWRSIYEVDGRMVADIIRPVPFGETRVIAGSSTPLLRPQDLRPAPADRERVLDVYRRFAAFADGWTALLPGDDDAIGDMRFSLDPAFRPPWALRLGRTPDAPAVAWEQRPFDGTDADGLLGVILGTSEALVPLARAAAPPVQDGTAR